MAFLSFLSLSRSLLFQKFNLLSIRISVVFLFLFRHLCLACVHSRFSIIFTDIVGLKPNNFLRCIAFNFDSGAVIWLISTFCRDICFEFQALSHHFDPFSTENQNLCFYFPIWLSHDNFKNRRKISVSNRRQSLLMIFVCRALELEYELKSKLLRLMI